MDNRKCPTGVTILAFLFFVLTIWNGLRLGEAIFLWKTLAEYGGYPFYLAATGAVWFLGGLGLVGGLWFGKPWARVAALAGWGIYLAWEWFDRLVLQKNNLNWPFALIVSVVFSSIVLVLFFLPGSRRYFQRDPNERKPKNPTAA